MARNPLMLLFATIFYCFVLVTEGRSVQQPKAVVQQQPTDVAVIDKNTSSLPDGDIAEYRFLTGAGGTNNGGGSSAATINDFITRKQQILESLRPQGGLSTGTGANIILVNAGATATGTGTATATGTAGTGAAAVGGSNVPGILIPQVIGAAAGGRRRRRPTQRRNNGSNGNQSQRQRPQIYVVRP